MSSFSPIIRVRKLLDKMKSERGEQRSPRLQNKRFHSRNATSDDILNSNSAFSSPNVRPKKSAKSNSTLSLELVNESLKEEIVGEDQFMYLPIEATLLILSFLEREELETVRLVSKLWNELSNDESLWKLLCVQDWNVHHLQAKTWKKTYHRLSEVLSDGVWEGMSKWLSPVGFDNEQRTTARLNFQKRTCRLRPTMNGGLSSPMSSPAMSSKSEIHRCASTTIPSQLTNVNNGLDATSSTGTTLTSSQPSIAASGSSSAKEAELRVHGSGITINCAAPSPFKIEGERVENDISGTTFRWNKLFEKHTSVYEGKINFADGSVSGTINYHDGSTHWKGEFHYKKMNRIKKYQLNA